MRQDRYLTELCNRISDAVPVQWDRLTADESPGGATAVYGWIYAACTYCDGGGEVRRNPGYPDPQTEDFATCPECGGDCFDRTLRADFVLVIVDEAWMRVVTSSAEHSEAITEALFPGSDAHVDCKRVEDELPGVKAAIRLDGSPSA